MNTLRSLAIGAILGCLSVIALAQTDITDAELNNNVDFRQGMGSSQRVSLREVLLRTGCEAKLSSALVLYEWLFQKYAQVLEPFLPRPVTNRRVESITEMEHSVLFQFRNLFTFLVSDQNRVISVSCRLTAQQRDRIRAALHSAISQPDLEAFVEALATRSGARMAGLDYTIRMSEDTTNDTSVTYLGCLPLTTYALGPGLSGNFDKFTGLPIHAQFAYDVPPYEPPYRDVIEDEEGFNLALPLAIQHVPWGAYRLAVLAPVYTVPDFGENQVYQSPRHAALIAANKRCLITDIIALPIRDDNKILQYVNFSFDSQTRELLAMSEDLHGSTVGTVSGDRKSALNLTQMVALPNLQLKMPLNSVKDAGPMPDDGLTKVIVRQGKFFFNAQLDPKQRVIWIEGRPYQATRAFTEKLLKLLPRSAL